MRIVIAGCGRVGGDLAREFAGAGHDVSVIDEHPAALERLGSTFDGSSHLGLAYDPATQREAGIEEADVFLAVTNSDNANLMAVEVAKALFRVPKTIARLDDPSREQAYRALDISYVAASKLVAKVIYEQVVEEEFEYHLTFESGDVEIVEMHVGDEAHGLHIESFEVPQRLRVAAVRRNGETLVPEPGFTLAAGDLVVAAAKAGVRRKVERYLADGEG